MKYNPRIIRENNWGTWGYTFRMYRGEAPEEQEKDNETAFDPFTGEIDNSCPHPNFTQLPSKTFFGMLKLIVTFYSMTWYLRIRWWYYAKYYNGKITG